LYHKAFLISNQNMVMPNYFIILMFASVLSLLLIISPTLLIESHAQNNTTNLSGNSSDISANGKGGLSAQDVYQNRMMAFGDSIKNIIILLPNEGHESPALPKDQRIINQPYVPENIVASPGTNIVWLNGDVGHTHTIILVDENGDQAYSSEKFDFNTVTNPLVLNKTGKFTYSEADVNQDDPKYVMQGTITVSENPSPNSTNGTSDTVAFFMVPAKDLDKHVSEITKKGIEVLDKYTFKDLRGGQKGTGPEQTLLLVGSKDGPSQLISTLQSIASTLPYS
jgi:plastocyanin